ncbi:MAG: hypothetical protein V9E94_04905 [Microthrixaceae bacterium]
MNRLAAETPASFVAFDLLALGDRSTCSTHRSPSGGALLEQAAGRRRAAGAPHPRHRRPRRRAPTGSTRFEGAGLDGVMAKAADGTYQPNKRAQLKVKHLRTADCVVAGFREHKNGDGTGLAACSASSTTRATCTTSAWRRRFSVARRAELRDELAPYVADDLTGHPWGALGRGGSPRRRPRAGACPAASRAGTPARTCRSRRCGPELVAEVAYERVDNGRFRHSARFQRWRPDRDPGVVHVRTARGGAARRAARSRLAEQPRAGVTARRRRPSARSARPARRWARRAARLARRRTDGTTRPRAPSLDVAVHDRPRPPTATDRHAPVPDDDPVDQSCDDVPDEVFAGLGDPRIDVADYQVRGRRRPRPRTASRARHACTLSATTAEPLRVVHPRPARPDASPGAGRRSPGAGVTGHRRRDRRSPRRPRSRPARPPPSVVITYAGDPEAGRLPRHRGITVGWQPDDDGGLVRHVRARRHVDAGCPCNDHPSDKATLDHHPRHARAASPASPTAASSRAGAPRPGGAGGCGRTDQPMAYLPRASWRSATTTWSSSDRRRRRRRWCSPSRRPRRRRRRPPGFDELDDDPRRSSPSTFGPYPDDDAGAIVVDTVARPGHCETQTRPLFGIRLRSGGSSRLRARPRAGPPVVRQRRDPGDRWQDLWLNEGFATYADWLWASSRGAEGRSADQARRRGARDGAPAVLHRPRRPEPSTSAVYERRRPHPARPAARRSATTTFFRDPADAGFADNYAGRSATTDDFVAPGIGAWPGARPRTPGLRHRGCEAAQPDHTGR